MNTLKIIGLWMGILVATLIGGVLLLPSKTHIEKSIIVECKPCEVYEMVNNYKNFSKWLPAFVIDSAVTYTYKGAKSGVGSEMMWQSDYEEVGSGKQWILVSEKNKYVKHGMECSIGGVHITEFTLEPVPEGTKVTWSYTGDVADTGIKTLIMGKFFGAFFMENMLGGEYEQGLLSLKEVIESAPPVDELKGLLPPPGYYQLSPY